MGDLGHVDAEGYLYLADRSNFLIITGGVNIYPQEIENTLVLHPDIADAAVIGEPDDELGQIAVAYVAPEEHIRPDEDLTENILDWLAERLSGFKIPRHIHYLESLPRTPTGKLVKHRIREHIDPEEN